MIRETEPWKLFISVKTGFKKLLLPVIRLGNTEERKEKEGGRKGGREGGETPKERKRKEGRKEKKVGCLLNAGVAR